MIKYENLFLEKILNKDDRKIGFIISSLFHSSIIFVAIGIPSCFQPKVINIPNIIPIEILTVDEVTNFQDDIEIILFVVLQEGKILNKKLEEIIRDKIKKNISPRHVPKRIFQVNEIPRTKSGKIVELAVRKLINGEELNNKEAIANPESLDFFKNLSQLKI